MNRALAKISTYASLVKFAHTLFALPFALIGFCYGLKTMDGPFPVRTLACVLLCMVFARNAAMGFNRYADRKIDALNPRTAGREVPAGIISPRQALVFVIVNALLFLLTAWFINPLAFVLSPLALLVVLGYSLTKRFTPLCHFVLGLGLAIAPTGAYIAVTGHLAPIPCLLSLLVITWVSSFDITYALQDEDFDRMHGLRSIPARLGRRRAIGLSIALHAVTALLTVWVGVLLKTGPFYWTGATLFIAVLVYEHLVVSPSDISRVNLAFATLNGTGSLVYAFFTLLSFYF